MIFNRPPRIQTPLPDDKVLVPKAPPIPSKPESGTWWVILLTVGVTLLSVVLMMVFMPGSSGLTYLLFLPIMLVSYVTAFFTTRSQKKKYTQKVGEARQKFRKELKNLDDHLLKMQIYEKRLRREKDPDGSECIRRAHEQDSRLGERRPLDPDFLCPRLGIGSVPATYQIQIPEGEDRVEELDDEYKLEDEIFHKFSSIEEVPLGTRLPVTGSIGLAGNRTGILDITRSFLVQIITHHWYSEVELGIICPAKNCSDWDWLQSLSHYVFSPLIRLIVTKSSDDSNFPSLRALAVLESELQRREQLVETKKLIKNDSSSSGNELPLPRLIIVVDYIDSSFSHPALQLLLRKGRELGVYGIFLTSKPEQVPGECGAIVKLSSNSVTYEESGLKTIKWECRPDKMKLDQAKVFIQSLNAINWPNVEDATQPPDTITFLELFRVQRTEDLPLEKWWGGEHPFGFLRAPIGKISNTHPLVFDLNDRDGAHGPHGLIGGMTGSGKSEVLKAIILALAVTHHPYDLNFALIDFKGGAAFNELKGLPHVVGVVTDIESNATYAERVIQALAGEIERRKRILEESRTVFRFGKSHVDEYRKLRVKKPMPHLVIIFDEFAEFKTRYKEESKKLISIARLGRSLGVHLILATQNIEAAIDPEILQNSTFRICLKVSKAEDSIQMVGIPDAVNLTRGRAYFRANTRVLYQSAYSGADYLEGEIQQLPGSFTRILPDGKRETVEVSKRNNQRKISTAASPATEASALVAHMIATAQKLHLKTPPSVWPEPLEDRIYLPELFAKNYSGGWDGEQWRRCEPLGQEILHPGFTYPILGLYDYPSRQKIFLMQMGPELGGGNLLIFGSPGSGKSTLLRTLVTSLARAQRPSDVHIYILDFGGQSALKVLEKYPHVGAVATRIEAERAERLIKHIQTEMHRRNMLLRNAQVDNWLDFNNQATPELRLPALYLIIDGFGNFRQTFPIEIVQAVMKLVSGGQASGLFLVAASSLQSDIPEDLFANINLRITFNQAKKEEYYSIVGQPSEAKIQEDTEKGLRPGRGLLRSTPPFEFQAALPVDGGSDKEQIENLTSLAEQMMNAWNGPRPPAIQSLPELLTLPRANLFSGTQPEDLFAEVGQDYEMLAPIGFNLDKNGPTYLITGTARQTGKTTFLQTCLISLAERYSSKQLQLILVDYHSRSLISLTNLPNIKAYVDSVKTLNSVLTDLEKEIRARRSMVDAKVDKDPGKFNKKRAVREFPHILLVIDDYGEFDLDTRKEESPSNESKHLASCLQQGGEYGTSYMIAGTTSEFPQEYLDPFLKNFKRHGCGVLLGGTDGIDIFNNMRNIPGQPPAGLPTGRGYLIRQGVARLFQTAVCWERDENPNDAINKRVEALKEQNHSATTKKPNRKTRL